MSVWPLLVKNCSSLSAAAGAISIFSIMTWEGIPPNGVDLVRQIYHTDPGGKIVFVTGHGEKGMDILRSGVRPFGFIENVWIRFPLAILIGGIIAAVFGILIGIPVLRLKGDYLAIVTLAFGEIIKNVFAALYLGYDSKGVHVSLKSLSNLNLEPDGKLILNGPQGISGTPNDSTFIIGAVMLLITLIIAYNFVYSRTGRAVMAIRDNVIAAESVGLNITKYKLVTFALTAFLAGCAGALYSHNFYTLQASKFDYNLSILILVFVVLGGIGSIRGSVIAAIVLVLLPEMLRSINSYRMLIYSIVKDDTHVFRLHFCLYNHSILFSVNFK